MTHPPDSEPSRRRGEERPTRETIQKIALAADSLQTWYEVVLHTDEWKKVHGAFAEIEALQGELDKLNPQVKRGRHPECASCDQIRDILDNIGDYKCDSPAGGVGRILDRAESAESRAAAAEGRVRELEEGLREIERLIGAQYGEITSIEWQVVSVVKRALLPPPAGGTMPQGITDETVRECNEALAALPESVRAEVEKED